MTHFPTPLSCPSGRLAGAARGFALGLILMAIALLGMLGTAVLLMSRTNTGESNNEAARTLGAALIAQGNNLKSGIAAMTSNGMSISSITFDTSATGLFNPSTGGIEAQVPSPNMVQNGSATWVWKVDGSGQPVVKLYNVGITGDASYVVALPYVEAFTCIGADLILHGTADPPQLAASTVADWQTPATAIDLSASTSGTQGWSDGCFRDASGSHYVFVMTVRPQ